MSDKRIEGWWFCAPDADGKVRLPHGDGREVIAGEALSVPGPVVLCEKGLHASVCAIDALQYAPGATVCRVEVWGGVVKSDDKIVGTHRRVLWMADATTALRLFACDCAESALNAERKAGREPDPRSWASVAVARRFALGEATVEELAAARAAAWAAAWDAAWAAAWDAARDAAWAAAWDAARDAAWAAAWDAARAAARDAAWDAAWAAARDAQNEMLEERLAALEGGQG